MRYSLKQLQIIEETNNINTEELSWIISWDSLFELAKFNEAMTLKAIYSKKICLSVTDADQKFESLLTLIKALCWLKQYSNAHDLIKNYNIKNKSKKERHLFSIIRSNLNILTNKQGEYTKSLYNDYLKGKRVKIEGPSPDHKAKNKTIEFDCLISFNYLGKVTNGAKPDISYYSKTDFINNYKIVIDLLMRNEIEFAVVNGFNINKLNFEIPNTIKQKIIAPAPFLLGLHAPLMGVPRCIYDLLLGQARTIYVTNSDLYTNFPYYQSEYVNSFSDLSQFYNSWAVHDLFFNYGVLKEFEKSVLVSGDDAFLSALDSDINGYIKKLITNVPYSNNYQHENY